MTFFALKGPNFNGNLFAQKALDNGAAYVVVDEVSDVAADRMIEVDDALIALQALALHHRRTFNIPFIAITGSNGKTTTKELLHAVLSSAFITYTTEGNLNNHIGVPLTILRVKRDAEMVVLEMGANHQKEIEAYCTYAMPTHGLITNAGKAHLEGFGGIEGVRKGKGELFDYLRKHEGTAFVMWDYDYLQTMAAGIDKVIKYGSTDADVTGTIVRNTPLLEVSINDHEGLRSIKTQLVGEYNFPNILAAVAVGIYFKVPPKKIAEAIEGYVPSNSRSQLVTKGSNTIILDAYNANPTSMKAAIENFAKIEARDKVLMLGGMAELGQESMEEHEQIVQLIDKYPWRAVVLVGGDFLKTSHPYISFPNSEAARQWLHEMNFQNVHLLVKGSRSMKMEKVLE